MSRKRNSNRKSMAILHSVMPCPSIEELEIEYYRPGCYCIPQAMPNAAPYSCAYLHEYAPQWTPSCSTATYVVDMYGMVYYLSDFEHKMQFSNNEVDMEIAYRIPTYVEEQDCNVATDEDEGEAVSPRKRERFEDETDNAEQDVVGYIDQHRYHKTMNDQIMAESQSKAEIVGEDYIVEEPTDNETKVDENDVQNGHTK